MKTKKCPKCKRYKPVDKFYKNNYKKSGLSSYCKVCHKVWYDEYRKTDKAKKLHKKANIRFREGKSPDYFKNKKLKSLYGVTLKQHKEKYLNQNGCCLICNRPVPYDNVDTDHDHQTGEFRGLLCRYCNSRLGWFEKYKNIVLKYIGD